jgi:hypothetical protein
MISLPSVLVKHPAVDGLNYICNNGPMLGFNPASSAWIVLRLCSVISELCMAPFGWFWKETLLVSSTISLKKLVSYGE